MQIEAKKREREEQHLYLTAKVSRWLLCLPSCSSFSL